MQKILVSACLLGRRVRYDASDARSDDHTLARWRTEGRLVAFCPEVAGGFPVPRPPAEVVGCDGADVLAGEGRVFQENGQDVSVYFLEGAELALAAARREGVKMAIMKEGSPSCGSRRIYDGSFSGRSKKGNGVTTALLEQNGIRVFSEEETAEAALYLRALERERL